jgi:hypothetical protein
MRVSTGFERDSLLHIDSPWFRETLRVNSQPRLMCQRISIPPGEHRVRFACDAPPILAPNDPRELVFRVWGFQLQTIPLED